MSAGMIWTAVFGVCVLGANSLPTGDQTEDRLRIEHLETRVQQIEASLRQNNRQLAAVQDAPTVAFTATLSQTISVLGSHQIVVFDNVVTNVGGGYNHLDGHFTAPVTGTYAFFVVVTSLPHYSASFYLLKNGAQSGGRVLANGFPGDSGNHLTSTLAVTVQLQAGDSVYVQNEEQYSTPEQIDGSSWSSFSGHLIK